MLAEWRTTERQLAGVDHASEEGIALAADIELLRSPHQELVRRAAERAAR